MVLSVRAIHKLPAREVRRIGRVRTPLDDVPTAMTWGVLRPVTNLHLRHLRSQIHDFGRRDAALVAYNLGARRVGDLRASGRPLPMRYANLVPGSIQ